MLLEAREISVLADGRSIVDRVSLTIDRQDFITIVGPNGAGKTTLLHCLMGVRKPDRGTVHRAPGIRIGYLPQSIAVDPVLPIHVRDFLRLRKSRAEPVTKAMFEQAVELCRIDRLLDHSLHHLSGGEWQRVLLARAIAHQPDFLILDEPAQNLDISGQLSLYRLLHDLYRERRMSLLMVSHDLHHVLSLTKRVICLYHHICCQGEPQNVAQDPAFTRIFGKDMANLTTVYSHHHNHQHAE